MRHIGAHGSQRDSDAATAVMAALAALSLFLAIAWEVTSDSRLVQLDRDLHEFVQQFRGEPFLGVCAFVSDLGGAYFRGAVLALVAGVLWLRRRRRTALIWIVAVVGAALCSGGLKAALGRTRPLADELDGSFVSGHAMGAAVLYGLLAYLLAGAARGFWRRTAIVSAAAALVLLISLSRIILGRHWATDVAGGLALGVAWTAAAIAVLQRLRRHSLESACLAISGGAALHYQCRSAWRAQAIENAMKKPAVFLDRDGTLIEDAGFLRDEAQVEFYPQTFAALRRLDAFVLFIVTNQTGIATGQLSADEARTVNDFVVRRLAEEGSSIREVYCCPHQRSDGCACMKPGIHFLKIAAAEYEIDLTRSFVVGDHPCDVELAHAVGARGIYVLTGHGAKHRAELQVPSIVVADIGAAVEAIRAAADAGATVSAQVHRSSTQVGA